MDHTFVIDQFYRAFQQKDYAKMNACYSEGIIFSDPVFILLHGDEVKCMWEMLCLQAKNFSLSYGNITAIDDEYLTCEWVASYTFSRTGRNVTNHAKAFMRIRDGVITEHSDAFRFSTWIAQAFGWKGYWLGWTGWMKKRFSKKPGKAWPILWIKKTLINPPVFRIYRHSHH